jgi:peptidoglycan/xylan/chitin deacetylase (PgdA/CDA1 family)
LYHKVDRRTELGITRTTPAGFRKQVKTLVSNDFGLRDLSTLFESEIKVNKDTNNLTTPHGQQVGLTFDDAYKSVYENALPVLQEFGCSGTVFIPSDYIGKVNTWDHGRFGLKFLHMNETELRQWVTGGGEVGSHGATHTHLSLLNWKERYAEIYDSKKKLEDILSQEITWFSPAFGWYDRHVLELVYNAGYKGIAVVSKKKWITVPDGLLLVPRQTVYLGDSISLLLTKILHTMPLYPLERLRQLLIHNGSWGTVIVDRIMRYGRF